MPSWQSHPNEQTSINSVLSQPPATAPKRARRDVRHDVHMLLAVVGVMLLGISVGTARVESAPQQPASASAAMYLNGSSYVSIANASLPAIGSSDFSLEAWIYPTDVSGFHAVFGKQYNLGFWFGIYNGKLRFYRGSTSYVESVTTIPVNRWTHIAVSSYTYYPCSPTNGLCNDFYINGDGEGDQEYAGGSAVGGTYDLRIGSDQNVEYFVGDIAEARLWNIVRGTTDIRHDMHVALDDKRPGLIASWHFTSDSQYADRVGNITGTPSGSPAFVGFPSPALPPVTPVDEFFNVLPQKMGGAGTAFVPRLNRAILAGGYRSGAPSSNIIAVDAGSGATMPLGSLPASLGLPSAAYADSNDTVYIFGGSPDTVDTTVNTIYAINPATGAVRTVSATLPQSLYIAAVVYHAGLNKILIIGGYDKVATNLNSVYVFDPASETIGTAPFTLPQAGYGMPAAYSRLSGKIYLFGGSNLATNFNTILEVTLNADGSGAIIPLAATLPAADARGSAVEDPLTQLIYVMPGSVDTRVQVFDPATGQFWRTPIEFPNDGSGNTRRRPYAGVVFSARNRQALILGGDWLPGQGTQSVWRVPLGSGPQVQLGRWDYDYFSSGAVNAIDGSGSRVYFATNAGGWEANGTGANVAWSQYSLPGAGSKVKYDPAQHRVYFASGQQAYRAYEGGGSGEAVFGPASGDGNRAVLALTPWLGEQVPLVGIFGGGSTGGGSLGLWAPFINGIYYSYAGYPASGECRNHTSIIYKPMGSLLAGTNYWGLEHVYKCGPNAPDGGDGKGPAAPAVNLGEHYITRLRYTISGGHTNPPSAYEYGPICLLGGTDPRNYNWNGMALGKNGDLWLAGQYTDGSSVCRYPAAHLPDNGIPAFNLFNIPTGVSANDLSVDMDGRIWFAVPSGGANSGGLSAFEVRDDNATAGSTVRASDFNWLNAPIGSGTPLSGVWDSGISTVGAVGEKVYATRDRNLFTIAQRWQQLDQSNAMRNEVVSRVWTARGRLFATTNTALHVLSPDGITWDNQATALNDVTTDQAGHIWVAHGGGANWWAPNNAWQTIPDLGLAEPVSALATDTSGRVWLGLADGVGMYDRNRLVARITPPTGAAPVTKLFADRNGDVWAGASSGLARFNARDASWTLFTTAQGLPANAVTDIAQRGDGTLFVSTTGGLATLTGGGSTFAAVSGSTVSWPLASDEAGRVWAGNTVETSPNIWQWYYWTNSGLRSTSVSSVAADGADRVWFSHPGGGISVRGAFLAPLSDVVPTVDGMDVYSGGRGDVRTINGSGFGIDPSELFAEIGGAPANILSASGSSMQVQLGANNLTGNVSVRRGKRKTTGSFTFCAVPRVDSFTPSGSNVGADIAIAGSNFDPSATVALGGAAHFAFIQNTTSISARVQAGDANGALTVFNQCSGMTGTNPTAFRKINVSITRGTLNQGYVGMGLFSGNATLASAYVSIDQALRAGDVLKLDNASVKFIPSGDVDGPTYTRAVTQTIPTMVGTPNPAIYLDIANAVNIPNIIVYGVGAQSAVFQLYEHGVLVAGITNAVNFQATGTPRVLLVPIMADNWTPATLKAMKALVDANIADYRYRIYPGGIYPVWSDEVLVKSKITASAVISVENGGQQNNAGIEMERIRKRWNSTYLYSGARVGVSFGVLDPNISDSSKAAGLGNLGITSGWKARQDCEDNFLYNVGDFLGIDKDCGPEFPQFLGWGLGDVNTSRYFAHELGHMMGLVPQGAPNFTNYTTVGGGGSHSGASELVSTTTNLPAACSELPNATFSAAGSFYRQPGISEPVLNPITGTQLYNQLADNNPSTARGKALLSYACGRSGVNTFFEPPDFSYLTAQRFSFLRPIYLPLAQKRPKQALRKSPFATLDKIHVAGIITPSVSGDTGAILQVENTDPQQKTSADYVTGYQLVEFNASNHELLRWGIQPLFDHEANNHDVPGHPPRAPDGAALWSASLPMIAGLARIDLVKGAATLGSFSAGGAPPALAISSPAGGESFTAGDVPIVWTATDADNDRVEVSVEFSIDNGTTWRPIASARGSGSLNVPVERLAGSATARIRVWGSDGFHSASAASNAFSVAAQPPLAYIMAPHDGASFLEGQPLPLFGRADDPQDGVLTRTTALKWSSSRDGALGAGESLYAPLSVGTHVVSLIATNSQGLTASAQVTLVVQANYAGDGIPDVTKTALGLNLLSGREAFGDAGGGITYIEQLHLGDNPYIPPNVLSVWPPSMSFTVDLSQSVALPQNILQAYDSYGPVSVTVSANAPWIDLSTAGGATPFVSTVLLNPILLNNGVQTATLTLSSELGTITVPVTATLTNKKSFCDVNGDGSVTQADVQAVQARLGATLGSANYDIRLDLNRDGAIDASDVALANSCAQTFGSSRNLYLPLIRR